MTWPCFFLFFSRFLQVRLPHDDNDMYDRHVLPAGHPHRTGMEHVIHNCCTEPKRLFVCVCDQSKHSAHCNVISKPYWLVSLQALYEAQQPYFGKCADQQGQEPQELWPKRLTIWLWCTSSWWLVHWHPVKFYQLCQKLEPFPAQSKGPKCAFTGKKEKKRKRSRSIMLYMVLLPQKV